MVAFTKVTAKNDADQDVHYRAPGGTTSTLCGLKIDKEVTRGQVTCYRCHQFAGGNL